MRATMKFIDVSFRHLTPSATISTEIITRKHSFVYKKPDRLVGTIFPFVISSSFLGHNKDQYRLHVGHAIEPRKLVHEIIAR